jgi:hypothetical protein
VVEHRAALVLYHHLRHTYASLLGDAGLAATEIAARLGHASTGQSEAYVHLYPDPDEVEPVGARNGARGCDLALFGCGVDGQAARLYSLISPPRMVRRRIRRCSVGSMTVVGGRGGCRLSVRCGRVWL